MDFVHYRIDFFFNLFNLRVQHLDQLDRMPQFQGLSRHHGANGVSGSIPDLNLLITVITAIGGDRQHSLQVSQVSAGNLVCAWKLAEERI